MDTAPLGVMEAPGRTSSYQRATEAGGGRGVGGGRTRSTVDPLLSPSALPSPPPLGLQLGKWTDISGVVTGQWSDISMGVAKVKRVQCHPPPHPSKPSGNLFFIEFRTFVMKVDLKLIFKDGFQSSLTPTSRSLTNTRQKKKKNLISFLSF